MPQVCVYLQLHQPYRLGNITVLNVGEEMIEYFADSDKDHNKEVFHKVAHHSYLPMLKLLLKLVKQHSGFSCALSCSGVFLEQAQSYQPEVISLLQQLVATGKVELLAETYYHSLASLYSKAEFAKQIKAHRRLLHSLFGVLPVVFRNTELVYSNAIAQQVSKLGFKGMLTEAVDRYLHGRPRTQLYVDTTRKLPLLLKHAQLSDDIAFRFSDQSWSGFPLSAEKYLEWLEVYPENETVNLFMDFETFGEHQWAATGIFSFFETFVDQFLTKPWNTFKTPSQLLIPAHKQLAQLPMYDVPIPISWADVDRDLTAWVENAFQQDCLRIIYDMEKSVLAANNPELLDHWRRLQTSDHFYYMCTKWSADGDVHAYFSPYESPFEAYRRFSIVLADVKARLNQVSQKRRPSR